MNWHLCLILAKNGLPNQSSQSLSPFGQMLMNVFLCFCFLSCCIIMKTWLLQLVLTLGSSPEMGVWFKRGYSWLTDGMCLKEKVSPALANQLWPWLSQASLHPMQPTCPASVQHTGFHWTVILRSGDVTASTWDPWIKCVHYISPKCCCSFSC